MFNNPKSLVATIYRSGENGCVYLHGVEHLHYCAVTTPISTPLYVNQL